MQLRLHARLRRIASSLMLLAMTAFVPQGAMIIVSQAAAFGGSMLHPAVTLAGPVHIHDNLAGQAHVHGGRSTAGHVHTTTDFDHQDSGEIFDTPFWTLGCTTAVIPAAGACAAVFEVPSAGERLLHRIPEGIDPDTLIRPPSTPSIA